MADESVPRTPPRSPGGATYALVVVGLLACAVIGAVQAPDDRANGLTVVLLLSAVVAGITVVQMPERSSVSAGFMVLTLAAAFLGPATCALCAVATEIAASRRLRTPLAATLYNTLGTAGPAIIVANLLGVVHARQGHVGFYLLVGVAGAVYLTLNYAFIACVYFPLVRGVRPLTLGVFWGYCPALALNIALAVAGAGIYVKVGLAGIVFALLALFSFSYMAHLLEQSRQRAELSAQRAEQYASLSFGVLSGLLRALDTRDGRAARHAAAVAAFARDMAKALNMSEREQELAHTAGLLHDIGHFALSDAVHERARTLNNKDWEDIWRHPELGAEMLKDLGIYGPVAEIVLAHHERIDGFGYPRGLTGQEIPAIAKIIAVAEVYDTLTAKDTYRTQMSSFEALTELRRVAGSQLEAEYVDVLAQLLSGEGLEYRHADAADFDRELDMERRIRQARAS